MKLEELKQLKTGDIVKFKVDGVEMVVDTVENNMVSCVIWNKTHNRPHNVDPIDYAMLTLVEKAD